MNNASESPHPAPDLPPSDGRADPWRDTTLWAQLAADPRLLAVTQSLLQSALDLFNAGDVAKAEETLFPAVPGCVGQRDEPELGAALMVLLLQVAYPRLAQNPSTLLDTLRQTQTLLDRLDESRRGQALTATARALMARLWASVPGEPSQPAN